MSRFSHMLPILLTMLELIPFITSSSPSSKLLLGAYALPTNPTSDPIISFNGPAVAPLSGTRPSNVLIDTRLDDILRRRIGSGDDDGGGGSSTNVFNDCIADQLKDGGNEDEADEEEEFIYLELFPLTNEDGASFLCETYTKGAFECVQYDDFTNVYSYFYGDDSYTSFLADSDPSDSITSTKYLEYHRSYEALRAADESARSKSSSSSSIVPGDFDLFLSTDSLSGDIYVCDKDSMDSECAHYKDFTRVYISAFGNHGYTSLFQTHPVAMTLHHEEDTHIKEKEQKQQQVIMNHITTTTSFSSSSSFLTSSPSNSLTVVIETVISTSAGLASSATRSNTVMSTESLKAHADKGLMVSNLAFSFLSLVFLGLLL